MTKLSDGELKDWADYQTSWKPTYEEAADMARELLELRASLKSFYETQTIHIKIIDELNAELLATEKVVEVLREKGHGCLLHNSWLSTALEAYDKVVKDV